MENKTHRLITVNYELYSEENGEQHLIEKTEEQKPMQFYTDCEMALPAFEQEVTKYATDSDFHSLSQKSKPMVSMIRRVFLL